MISELDLLWWCSLQKAFALTDVQAVCDLGQQELFYEKPEVSQRVIHQFAARCGVSTADLSNCRSSADLWRALGREIVSLDVVGSGPDFHYFDLNTDSVPNELRARFDFVTNVGTSEHVLNQYNTFKVMHDLTRRGGIMVHAIPTAGFSNHGFFHYNMKLFWRLSKVNIYDCLDAWMSCDKNSDRLAKDVAEFVRGEHGRFANTRAAADHPVKHFGNLAEAYRSTRAACMFS
jgi:hypothetical protein